MAFTKWAVWTHKRSEEGSNFIASNGSFAGQELFSCLYSMSFILLSVFLDLFSLVSNDLSSFSPNWLAKASQASAAKSLDWMGSCSSRAPKTCIHRTTCSFFANTGTWLARKARFTAANKSVPSILTPVISRATAVCVRHCPNWVDSSTFTSNWRMHKSWFSSEELKSCW